MDDTTRELLFMVLRMMEQLHGWLTSLPLSLQFLLIVLVFVILRGRVELDQHQASSSK